MYNSSHGIIKEINTPHEENKRETQHKVGDAMELKEQRYVCTLAEYGNLTRAADRLYISQPALSIYISNLEKHLGTPLFDREGKKIRTDQGWETVCPPCPENPGRIQPVQ